MGLLSDVSLLIPEEKISHRDPYGIDAKLDFLCGLRLLPTPLVKECPNATKKWLKATISVPVVNVDYSSTGGTGINCFDLPENLLNSVRFDHVFLDSDKEPLNENDATQISYDTGMIAEEIYVETNQNHEIFQTLETDRLQPSTIEPLDQSERPNQIIQNVTACSLASRIPSNVFMQIQPNSQPNTLIQSSKMAYTVAKIPSFVTDNQIIAANKDNHRQASSSNSASIQSKNTFPKILTEKQKKPLKRSTTSLKNGAASTQSLIKPMYVAQQTISSSKHLHASSNKMAQKLDMSDLAELKALPKLIHKEIFEQEINQTIFAFASINKTQGYFSELLKKCTESSLPGHVTPCYRNLLKMRQFLTKSLSERKSLYTKAKESMKKTEKQPENLQNTPKIRTNISKETKEELVTLYNTKQGILKPSDITHLANKHKLTEKNIKVFYKNMKLRKKL